MSLDVEKDSYIERVNILQSDFQNSKTILDEINSKIHEIDRNISRSKNIISDKKNDLYAAEREIEQTKVQLDRLIGEYEINFLHYFFFLVQIEI